MDAYSAFLTSLTAGLLRTSLQASVVIGLVLLVQGIFRRRLAPRWRYLLWLLVLTRLLLPASFETCFSLFNLAPVPAAKVFHASGTTSTAPARPVEATKAPAPPAPAASVPAPTASAGSSVADVSANPSTASTPVQSNATNMGGTPMPRGTGVPPVGSWPWAATLSLMWLAGVLFLLARIIVIPRRLNARLAQHETALSPAAFDILEQSKRLIGVNQVLPIVQSRAVQSPALLGFIRPWLLLPHGLIEKFSAEELRFVFLHELAHLKRRDIAINWLMTLLQILHWFNPLVWYAFARMRADRELACDELALSFARAGDNQTYGQAILKLLEAFTRPAVLPGLVGILEDRSQMQRRIIMIAQFQQTTRWSTTAAALLLTLGALTLTDAQSEPTLSKSADTGMTVRRLLADASNAGENLTADGKYIRGLDWDTGDVVQYEIASGEKSRIKNQGSWSEQDKTYEAQVLSPDGGQIAYSSYAKDWTPQLQVRNLDGSAVRTLYREKGAYVYSLSWSPDAGSILALRSRNKANELTAIALTDGSVRVLKALTGHIYMCSDARFSPDGRYVAFDLVREGNPAHSDVFLMAADGRDEVPVAEHPAEDRLVGWSPDGSRLVFRSDRSGTWDLWSVAIKEGKPQGSPTMLKRDFGPGSGALGFAPDGSCFYTTTTETGGLYRGSVDFETGKMIEPPAPVALRYTGRVAMPLWSPDGRHLLYVSNRAGIGPGNNILTIRNADSGAERFLSPPLRFVNFACWSPDGRSVLALGISEKGNGLFRIDTETSEITRLSEHGFFPRLTPDGKTLVYTYEGILRKRNLATGKESEVIKTGKVFRYDLSPDGREVVYQLDDVVICASLDGGEPRELVRGLAKNLRMKWTSDGRHIVAFPWSRGTSKIWFIPAQGGTPLKMDLSIPRMDYFALHPDNRRFVYCVGEKSTSELWVLENFLPKATLAAK